MTLLDAVVALGLLKADVLSLLRKIEWNGSETHFQCPKCGESRVAGHTKPCLLAAVLEEVIRPEQAAETSHK